MTFNLMVIVFVFGGSAGGQVGLLSDLQSISTENLVLKFCLSNSLFFAKQ